MFIGVTGKKRAGKDTLANYLVQNYGFNRVGFADPVRDLSYRINPLVEFNKSYHDLQYIVDILGWEEAKEVPGVRKILQNVGNEAREVLGNNIWVDKALPKGTHISRLVVSDVRYLNEAEGVRRNGGRVVKVVRPEVSDDDTHPSETEMDRISPDFTLINDGTKEDLFAKVDALMKSWGGSTV